MNRQPSSDRVADLLALEILRERPQHLIELHRLRGYLGPLESLFPARLPERLESQVDGAGADEGLWVKT